MDATFVPSGEVLTREEPYVHVLFKSSHGTRCDWCFKVLKQFGRCIRCHSVWYCNEECQKSDWVMHKIECKSMVGPSPPSDRVRMIMRAMHNEVLLGNCCSVKDKLSMLNETTKQLIRDDVTKAITLLSNKFTEEAVFDIAYKIQCNVVEVTDDLLSPIGEALYSWIGRLNHSCEPNCALVFNGRAATVRSIKRIKRSSVEVTELYISYVDLMWTYEERKAVLNNRYAFDCHCERCLAEEGLGFEEGEDVVRTLEMMSGCFQTQDCQGVILHYNQFPIATISICAMHKACVMQLKAVQELHDYSRAIETASRLIEIYRYLPPYHPRQGLAYLQLARLQIMAHRPFQQAILTAVGVMSSSHGEDHAMVKEAVQLALENGCTIEKRHTSV